jgi:hypothetical protein
MSETLHTLTVASAEPVTKRLDTGAAAMTLIDPSWPVSTAHALKSNDPRVDFHNLIVLSTAPLAMRVTMSETPERNLTALTFPECPDKRL